MPTILTVPEALRAPRHEEREDEGERGGVDERTFRPERAAAEERPPGSGEAGFDERRFERHAAHGQPERREPPVPERVEGPRAREAAAGPEEPAENGAREADVHEGERGHVRVAAVEEREARGLRRARDEARGKPPPPERRKARGVRAGGERAAEEADRAEDDRREERQERGAEEQLLDERLDPEERDRRRRRGRPGGGWRRREGRPAGGTGPEGSGGEGRQDCGREEDERDGGAFE